MLSANTKGKLTSMDQFSNIDENKGIRYVQTQNKYCMKYLAVFSIRKTNFSNVTNRQLFEKEIFH